MAPWVFALALVAGCDAAGPNAGSGGPPAAAGCEGTSTSCYCTDGNLTGTQACDPVTGLSACDCPPIFQGSTPPPSGGSVARVCSALSGSAACNATSYVSEQVPSSVLFVLDRSGSMACNAPPVQTVDDCNTTTRRLDPNQPSRWEITVEALNDAFAGLAGTSVSVGLSLFSSDGSCGVSSAPAVELGAPAPEHLGALSSAMTQAVPAGGTPIVGGVIVGYKHLHEEIHAGGNRYVVLITDGEESCGTKGDETDRTDLESARARLLTTEVKKARDANIKTFVIGAPGSEGARGFLSDLAFLGGTARTPSCVHGDAASGDCHYDLSAQADFGAVLRATLDQIGGKALGCEFRTPPGSADQVNVQYSRAGADPVCFSQDTRPCDAGADGWQFAKDAAGNDDRSRVVLCGAACEQVKADPSTVVDVVLGCDVLR